MSRAVPALHPPGPPARRRRRAIPILPPHPRRDAQPSHPAHARPRRERRRLRDERDARRDARDVPATRIHHEGASPHAEDVRRAVQPSEILLPREARAPTMGRRVRRTRRRARTDPRAAAFAFVPPVAMGPGDLTSTIYVPSIPRRRPRRVSGEGKASPRRTPRRRLRRRRPRRRRPTRLARRRRRRRAIGGVHGDGRRVRGRGSRARTGSRQTRWRR